MSPNPTEVQALEDRYLMQTYKRAPVEFVRGDVRDAALVDRSLVGIDAVVHLAAKVGLGVDIGDAPDYVSSNDYGTAEVLAAILTDEGYAAVVRGLPLAGEQLCQQHCPVSHVAHEFPQLCEAETEAIGRVLGRHVQRLATIAHGDGVCTTCIPNPERVAP